MVKKIPTFPFDRLTPYDFSYDLSMPIQKVLSLEQMDSRVIFETNAFTDTVKVSDFLIPRIQNLASDHCSKPSL